MFWVPSLLQELQPRDPTVRPHVRAVAFLASANCARVMPTVANATRIVHASATVFARREFARPLARAVTTPASVNRALTVQTDVNARKIAIARVMAFARVLVRWTP